MKEDFAKICVISKFTKYQDLLFKKRKQNTRNLPKIYFRMVSFGFPSQTLLVFLCYQYFTVFLCQCQLQNQTKPNQNKKQPQNNTYIYITI